MGDQRAGIRELTRRTLLLGASASAIAAAGCAEAVTRHATSSRLAAISATPSERAHTANDVALLRTAAALENLGVYAYGSALHRVASGQMGPPPAVVMAFASQVRSHHAQHAQALNRILERLGSPPYTRPDPAMFRSVEDGLPAVGSIKELAIFSLTLEDALAQTHLRNLTALTDRAAIVTTAAIGPVEQQHVALLHINAGQFPVLHAFGPTDQARPVTDPS